MIPYQYVYRVDRPAAALPSSALASRITTDSLVQIISAFSGTIRYLGPLRADPYAIQSYSPSGQPDDVGPHGEYAAAVYASNRKQLIRFWNPDAQQIETATLESSMDIWLRYLGVADHVSTREAA